MSWLGQGFSRESMQSLGEAYQQVDENRRAARAAGGYKDDSKKQTDPSKPGFTGISNNINDIMRQNKEIEAKNKAKAKKEDFESDMEIIDEYSVSVEDGMALEEGKKKCKEGYKYDSDKKKCVKKKKKKSSSKSSKTTVVVKTGGRYGGGYWGGGYHGHGGSGGGGSDNGDGETESNGGGDGGGDGGGGE
jgi:hypothetical protein